MRRKPFRQLLALVLALIMAFQLLPLNAIAENLSDTQIPTEDLVEEETAQILEEIEELRTEGGKQFRMSDGTYMSVSYGMPIHYQNTAGTWENIDNTMTPVATASNGVTVYSAENGDSTTSFSGVLTDGLLFSTGYGGSTISMMLVDPSELQQLTANDQVSLITSSEDGPLTYNRDSQAQFASGDATQFSLVADTPSLAEQVIPNTLSSTVLYEDVYPNVDLLYNVTGYNIKESIIINSPMDEYSFSFRITLDGLYPSLTTEGSIVLADKTGSVVYEIPAPYMYDTEHATSSSVEYQVTELDDGFILTVEADPEWINDSSRAFPVTIDPTLLISAGTAQGDISATHVEEGLPADPHGHYQDLYLGYTAYEDLKDRQIYMHFNTLPDVPFGSVVVNATLNLWHFDYSSKNTSAIKIGAYEVTTEKPSSYSSYHDWIYYMTWNNKAAYDTSNMIDFATLSADTDDTYVSWDLTELVNDWYYNNEENATIILKTIDTYSDSAYGTAALYAYGRTYPPILTVTYRNNTGLEPYYTYQAFDVGDAGVAYISDYSSQLTIVNELFSFNSTILPMSFQLVFNSTYFAERTDLQYDLCKEIGMGMHVGSGITYNFIQHVSEVTISGIQYIRYLDGDGTIHYFMKDPSGQTNYYYDEDGLGLKIEEYMPNYYRLSDDKGNALTFVHGLLLWIADEEGNRYELCYSQNGTENANGYPTGNRDRLERIDFRNTDKDVFTIASFSYVSQTINNSSVSNYLSSITDYAGNVYSFEYLNGKLSAIRRNSTYIAQYSIPTNNGYYANQIDAMTDVDSGYTLNFTYTNHQITKIKETNGTSVGKEIQINPLDNRYTEYTDLGNNQSNTSDDITTCYAFDYAGRTINVYSTDSSGRIVGASNALYQTASSDTDKRKNKISQSAVIGVAAETMLENGGFESTGWTLSSFSRNTSVSRTGTYSIRSNLTSATSKATAYLHADSLATGVTYTVSAYINTSNATFSNGTGIYFEIQNYGGTSTFFTSDPINYKTSSGMDNGWVRLSYTFTTKTYGQHRIVIVNEGVTGNVYVDDVQLEKGSAPSSVNLLDNGDFENSSAADWTSTGTTALTSGAGMGGSKAMKLTGYYSTYTKASKTVTVNQPGTQTYVLSGWAKGNAVPDTTNLSDQWRSFGLRATITYSDNSTEVHFAPFNSALSDWQFSSVAVVPKEPTKTVKTIRVECAFESNANIAYFDNIALTREPAQTMKYDEDGNLESVTTVDQAEDTSTYENGNLIRMVTEGYGTFEYTYDQTYTHRLTSVTNGQVTQMMGYDTYGNATSTTLTGEGTTEQITTSAEYDFFGNLLTSVTDAAGNETTYAYASNQNKQLGAPSSVTNALNVTVDYAYDDLDRAESTTIADLSTVDYGYNPMGYLSEVSRTDEVTNNSQKYTLYYDSFGNIKDIKVGTAITLASYTYGPNNGNLSKQTYGNGDTVTYTYDDLGRVENVVWADGRNVTYTYNGEGSLYSATDSESGYTYYYTYDSLGRLIDSRAVKNDATVLQTRQEYDSNNRLKKQYLNLVDKTITESYNYDTEDGKLTSVTFSFGLGNKTLTLAYDELERLESRSNPVVRADYTYIPNAETGTTTTLVESLEYTRLTGTSLPVMRFEYDYDKLGNITSIVDPILEATKEYTYDELGQMTQEKLSYNSGTTTTYNYTYDRYGNILTGRGKSYTYGNSTWQDLLTAYDGKKIAYEGQTYTVSGDNITVSNNNPVSGNPISYYNGTRWTFGWENGRELATATDGDVSISYAYDLNGIRTTKTVDGVVHEYLYAGDKLIRYRFGNTVMEFLYDQNGAPFAMIYNGTPLYYVLNLQGDVVRLVNGEGASYGVYRYDAWGNILYESNNEYIRANPLRYRGYVYDTDTGFYYLQSRYYDPQIGRFINADSYASTGQGFIGYNMFAYCGNNPVVFTDPYGYEGFVGFGFQFDVSTDHGTYGVEIVVYVDPAVVAATTDDESDKTAVALYTYSGISVSQLELMFAPQIVDMTSSFDFESLNTTTADELLISLSAVMSGFQLSGSVFAIYGYDNFVSAYSYSGAFDTISASISKPISTLSGGAYYSYSNTCCVVGAKVGVSTSPKFKLLPLEVQFSHTYYSEPVIMQ